MKCLGKLKLTVTPVPVSHTTTVWYGLFKICRDAGTEAGTAVKQNGVTSRTAEH